MVSHCHYVYLCIYIHIYLFIYIYIIHMCRHLVGICLKILVFFVPTIENNGGEESPLIERVPESTPRTTMLFIPLVGGVKSFTTIFLVGKG